MIDEGKLTAFFEHVIDRAGDQAWYARVVAGSSWKRGDPLGTIEGAEKSEADELAEAVVLLAEDHEGPRLYVYAFPVGGQSPDFGRCTIALASSDGTTASVGEVMGAVVELAKDARRAADQANRRAERSQRQVLDFLQHAMNAERETSEIELMAELSGSDGERRERMLKAFLESALGKAVGAKLLGMGKRRQVPPATKAEPQLEAKSDGEPSPATPTATPEATSAEAAKRSALEAVAALHALYEAHPELAKDHDLVEGMSPLVLAALTDPPAPRE